MSDIVLRGGTVVGGAGGPPYRADVAVSAGRIQAVGDLRGESAALALHVGGLIVAPGFIDCHSHADAALLHEPRAEAKVAQGVTTEIVGNCGFGLFPVRGSAPADLSLSADSEGRTFAALADYRAALAERDTAVNVASLLPHGPLRNSVVGPENRPASEDELRAMCHLAREALEQGAVGISFGLLYAPGCFASDDEIIAIAREAASFGRPIVFHVRNESDRFRESIAEAIEIGRLSGAPVHISHLKVADPAHWGQIGEALALIEDANARGQRVTCDQYPYTAGSSPFTTLVPPWALAGGMEATLSRLRAADQRARIERGLAGREHISGWPNLSLRIGWQRTVVGYAPAAEEWEGRSIADIADSARRPPHNILFDLLLRTNGAAIGIWHLMCEEDVRAVMQHPAQMVGSDGLHTPGKPHPRLRGTFPRVLGRYSRELGLLTLEGAVHKMTGKPAATFGLPRRGTIEPGWHADICVFDAQRIEDRATYKDPTVPPEGIVHVVCNGTATMLNGERTESRPGAWVA
jgi:dihydroorotase/N-acyl-D-amino-acid deacylase